MPRNPRCVLPGVAYHVTQRGVDRADVFFSQADRETYLRLVEDHRADADARILAWCLMTNHVHWVLVPQREDSLAVLFRRVHGRYAQYLNARRGRTGHLWQNRFFSCPVAAATLEIAVRYVEWNPVRAALVERPEAYRWSSAAAHLRGPEAERIHLLDWSYWHERGGAEAWQRSLDGLEDPRETRRLKRATYAGAPFGPAEFVASMEHQFGRQWRTPGRPKKPMAKQEKGTEQSASVSAG